MNYDFYFILMALQDIAILQSKTKQSRYKETVNMHYIHINNKNNANI